MRNRAVAGVLLALFVAACGGDTKITEPLATVRVRHPVSAVGTDSVTGARIETDLDDYSPGQTVHVVGTGWLAGETVNLTLVEDPDTHEDIVQNVQANDAGAFSLDLYVIQLSDLGALLTLTAKGQTSGSVAVATFTDGTISLATIETRDGASCSSPQGTVPAGTAICAHSSFTISGEGATAVQIRWKNPAGNIVQISQRSPDFDPGTTGINVYDATFTPTVTGTWTVLLCEGANTNLTPAGVAGCQSGQQRAVQTFQVTPGSQNTTTSVVSNTSPSVSGQGVTFTATVTAGATPVTTGNVTFKVGGTACSDATTTIGSAGLNGSGEATSAAHAFNATETGTVVRACFEGATGFNASEGSTTQTVNKANTNTALADSPTSSTVGQTVTFTATVTAEAPGTGTPTGTVTLYEFTTGNCAVPAPDLALGSGAAGAGINVSSLTAGNHTITACYAGDDNFNASSGTDTHSVSLNVTTTAITSSINPTVTGQSTTFTATVKDAANAAVTSGSITFKVGGTGCTDAAATVLAGPTTVNGSGEAATSKAYNASESPKTIRACYSGTTTFAASENSLTQIINKGSTTTSVTASPASSVFGQSVTFTATVTPGGAAIGTPTGVVSFYNGGNCASPGTTIAANVSLSGGQATGTTSKLAVATHSIVACYLGDVDFEPSSGTLSYTVTKASTMVTLGSSSNPSTFGDPVTFTATVSVVAPGAGTPTGTVNFADGGSCDPTTGAITGGTSLGSAALSSGSAGVTTSALGAGSHTIVACYGGDGSFNGSKKYLTQTVNPKPTNTAVTVETTTPQYSDKVKLKAVVTPHTVGSSELKGTVTFYINGSVDCTTPPATSFGSDEITEADDGVAVLESQILLSAGNYTVTGCFVSSNANFGNSSGTAAMALAKEDATVAPASPYGNAFAIGGSGTSSFTLAFTVRERNPEPDVNAGALPGDVDNTGLTVSLNAVGNGANNKNVTCTASATIPPPLAYADVKTYTCQFTNVAVDAYEVDADVTGYHYIGGYIDALTVYDPGAGFVTGGGKFVYPDPLSERVSFGLSFTFTGKGKTTARGNLVVIRHLTNGDVCRAKSNAIDAPAVVGKTASFSGKGNYACVRPNGETYDGIGNQTILGWVEDNGEGSTATAPDRFWVNMNVPNSKLLLGTPASSNAAALTGGNVQVPQPSGK